MFWCLIIVILVTVADPWQVSAIIAPMPDFSPDDYQRLYEMRQHHNMTHDYQPTHLSPWHCKMSTEEDCRREDAEWRDAQEERRLSGDHNARRLNPSIGNPKVLVLLVIFKGDEKKKLPQKQYWEELFNGQGTSDVNPAGSVREWLRYASLGQYVPEFVVRDWYQLPGTEKSYANGISGRSGVIEMMDLFRPAIEAVDDEWGVLEWAETDRMDNNLKIDHLVVIHSGFGAEWGDKKNKCGANTFPNRIWSQGSASAGQGSIEVESGNFAVGGYVLASAFDVLCTDEPAKMAIITHEYQHGFHLIDLYDNDGNEAPIGIGGVGNYDIMANVHGWTTDRAFPGHMGPFSRMEAGWLEPVQISKNGVYAIQPSEVSGQIYVIKKGYPDGEYLLIESRQKIKWDGNWPQSGLVVWHIDQKAPFMTERGYPGKKGWPGQHYRVTVLQADGKYDIEKGNNLGDVDDLWTQGMTLPASKSKWPNTASYQNGLKETGIAITVLSRPGFIMNFLVTGVSGAKAPKVPEEFMYDDEGRPLDIPGVEKPGLQGTPEGRNKTGQTLAWVLSLLTGVGVMVGLLSILL